MAGVSRKNTSSVRQGNIELVLDAVLRRNDGLSRAEVADFSGLTRSTVSRLVEELLEAGLISEGECVQPPIGRPYYPLLPSRRHYCCLAIEINVDYIALMVMDMAGDILFSRRHHHNSRGASPEKVFAALNSYIADALDELREQQLRIITTVMAVPGLIQSETGTILTAPNLGWKDVRPADFLDFPEFNPEHFTLMNEADTAAHAFIYERPGVSTDFANFIYVSAEVGVGAAIVVDGHLFTGARGWAGEIGHTCVNVAGPKCSCGSNGCLEQYAGWDAMMAVAQLPAGADIDTLCEAFDGNDAAARAAVDACAQALGTAVANALNLLDVDVVVLGGNFARLYSRQEIILRSEVEYRALSRRWSSSRIEVCEYGDFAAVRGGCLMGLSDVIQHPESWASYGIPIDF